MLKQIATLTYLLIYVLHRCDNKYVEGEIDTRENWAFIARFCFLSDEGQFEYLIEFDEDQGAPNLLLYYDADDQWPAVYKSNKSCYGKESVLRIEQNQIINLTTRFPFREASGCMLNSGLTTLKPKYTLIMPTVPTMKATKKKRVTTTTVRAVSDLVTTEVAENATGFYEANGLDTTTETIFATSEFAENLTAETATWATIATTKSLIKKRSVEGSKRVICKNARRFRSSRERWWFIAVSNCNGTQGIRLKYRILMTNGHPGDYWHEHFSADEFYVLPVLMAFSVAYSFLQLGIVVCSVELKSRQLLHSTYKLFVLSVLVQFVGIIFRSMSFLKYAVNGLGSPNLKTAGAVFAGISETCFLLLLLLLAKGYTVTRGRLPLAAGVKLTIFMCVYAVTYVSLFIYETKVFDPGEVLYMYESPAGYGLIILRILAWCMFIYSTVFTLKHYPEKANFYYPFNIFGTLWFIAGPAFILCANSYVDKWVRESVVNAVLLFIAFGGHLMFLLLTMPSVANKNFPYHVRTTQIGVMEVTGSYGNSSIEQFGHHVYEPSGNVEQVIIPLTRRTEEIFGGVYSQHVHSAVRRSAEADGNGRNDVIMENVVSWSLAKNLSTLEAARNQMLGSMRSKLGELPEREAAEATEAKAEPRAGNLDEWVREVPVELFTVSKMVVTKRDSL